MKDYRSYHAGDREAAEYQIKVLFFTIAVYACFAVFAAGAIKNI